MKAIILAAGRGTRMKDLTKSKPKCLLKLGGKTLLQWQTLALLSEGISNITIIRGYRSESFTDSSYKYIKNPYWNETNMVYTLARAQEILEKETHIISYADIVYHRSIVNSLKESIGDIVISYDKQWESLWKERFINPLEDIETFQSLQGKLLAIGKKPKSFKEVKGQYMGLLKITPKGWKKMKDVLFSLSQEKQKKLDMTAFLQELLQQGVAISTVSIQGKWCEVDRKEDLKLYERKLSTRQWTHDWR